MEFTDRTGFKVYFCDPQSPGLREPNKNSNELIRLLFPKKTCLKKGSSLVVVAEGMIMVYLIARGHSHGRKFPLRSYSQSVHSVSGNVHFLDENVGSVTVTVGIAEKYPVKRYGRKAERLEVAHMVLPDTSRCWTMKELARELWNRQYDEHSRRLWLEWMDMEKDVGVPLLSSAARTLRKRLYGMPKEIAAHSSVSTAGKGLVGKGSNNFKYSELPNKAGELISRNTDSEYKILDNLADKLGNNVTVKGSVTIFTERPACGSCLGVVEQFQQKYPGIKVDVLDNNGIKLRPGGKK